MVELRLCPDCELDDKKSRLDLAEGPTTPGKLEIYFDEDGLKHVHDPTIIRTIYTCSNGHKNTIINTGHCPTCTWRGPTE